MDEAILGMIIPVGFSYAVPSYYMAYCNGQQLSVSTYTLLFSLIGKIYGGDGISTFNLPNLQGMTPVGQGTFPGGQTYTLGQTGGYENVNVNLNNLPAHTHPILSPVKMPANTQATTSNPKLNIQGMVTGSSQFNTSLGSNAEALAPPQVWSQSVGGSGGATLPSMSPYQVVNFLICTQGVYPPRP